MFFSISRYNMLLAVIISVYHFFLSKIENEFYFALSMIAMVFLMNIMCVSMNARAIGFSMSQLLEVEKSAKSIAVGGITRDLYESFSAYSLLQFIFSAKAARDEENK